MQILTLKEYALKYEGAKGLGILYTLQWREMGTKGVRERAAEDEVNTEMLETSELSKQYIRIFLHCS